jgi:hypothetical protein
MRNLVKHGWSAEKLKTAFDSAEGSGSSALMVVENGMVVDLARQSVSVSKSFRLLTGNCLTPVAAECMPEFVGNH